MEKSPKTPLKLRFLSFAIFIVYSLLKSTWRIRFHEPPWVKEKLRKKEPFVIAHWHQQEFALVQLVKHYHAAPIVSQSKDGELIAGVIHRMGSKTARGSSSRGGVQALKTILRLSKEGWRPCVAVDGPRGPIFEVKPGVFEISRLTHLPIGPLAITADRCFHFHKSWNKAYLPKPFAKVQVTWGNPLGPVPRDGDSRDPVWAKGLQAELHNIKQQAEKLLRGDN
jgi:lysophospholipid acyltransferase (LPLAT)-like uncharacterized protein